MENGDLAAFTLDRLRKMVDGDVRQVERLTRLIDDMFDISRITLGKLSRRREKF